MANALFYLMAFGVIALSLGVILSKNPVKAVLSLLGSFFCLATIYLLAGFQFLAAAQILVYAGAILVLFLFVIMLLGVDVASDIELGGFKGQREAAAGFAVVALAVLGWVIANADPAPAVAQSRSGALDEATPDVNQLAHSLFSDYVYAFELTSVLLVVAVIGAVVLARRQAPLDEEVDA